YHIDIRSQRARQFKISDFDEFDHILVMDRSNYSNVVKLARSDEDARKVRPILDFLNTDDITEVPDPYYGGDHGFEHVFQLLNEACDLIIRELT
ncbi:MAG: low molecular weight phosphotyrosine protein phosphatase, partial [Flavobacteriaceae bacterium]|nr:low molecular weight phosphotyrosine protein phosphatase [Flavobacteriaceae bacterium]